MSPAQLQAGPDPRLRDPILARLLPGAAPESAARPCSGRCGARTAIARGGHARPPTSRPPPREGQPAPRRSGQGHRGSCGRTGTVLGSPARNADNSPCRSKGGHVSRMEGPRGSPGGQLCGRQSAGAEASRPRSLEPWPGAAGAAAHPPGGGTQRGARVVRATGAGRPSGRDPRAAGGGGRGPGPTCRRSRPGKPVLPAAMVRPALPAGRRRMVPPTRARATNPAPPESERGGVARSGHASSCIVMRRPSRPAGRGGAGRSSLPGAPCWGRGSARARGGGGAGRRPPPPRSPPPARRHRPAPPRCRDGAGPGSSWPRPLPEY